LTVRYRFVVESPYVGGGWDEEIEFDNEPSEAELGDELETIYANHFPGSWERVGGLTDESD
jgi:hypothetical protein